MVELWGKMMYPVRRVWRRLGTRLGIRKTGGLLMLRGDVKQCEYEDVHILWEMLQKTESATLTRSPDKKTNKTTASFWNIFGWARSAPCIGCGV